MDVVRRAARPWAHMARGSALVLKADIRPGFEGELTAKIERLEKALDRQQAS